MILRTGTNKTRAFTLIEALVAVTILAVGMVGVIRAYIVLINSIEASRFMVEASYLLKDRIALAEQAAIEPGGIAPGLKRGMFTGDYKALSWEEEVSEITITGDSPKDARQAEGHDVSREDEEREVVLSDIRISIIGPGPAESARKLSLYTYLEKPVE
jgi:prepilin-type N-terminal cleavage/methylation domain-containing protein